VGVASVASDEYAREARDVIPRVIVAVTETLTDLVD
jgi:hypothetical protein